MMFGPLPHRVSRAAVPSLREIRAAESRAPALPAGTARIEKPARLVLALGALGVVYGDIGTNPLFALQEAFSADHGVARTPENVLGVLSLVFWSLIVVVTVKYLGFLMRVSNDGEGGILALLALVPKSAAGGRPRWLVLAVLFGAALLYGDGVITPAISVLSAVEGLKTAAPATEHAVVPLTIVILLGLFFVQKRGTHRIGTFFGPVMIAWFLMIGAYGARQLVVDPHVLAALDPRWAIRMLAQGSTTAIRVLGAVVLTIAGGEALYADMGHFGRRPIQLAWYGIVLPGLVLSYFGQGVRLLGPPLAPDESPFYAIVPPSLLLPTIALAAAATVIASQALISGAFSLTQQAVQLGYFPRVRVLHTSAEHIGQIYVPLVNAALMVACVALVAGFGASDKLAAAYGLAVSGTMAITSVAYFVVLRRRFGRPLAIAALVAGSFFVIDIGYFGANIAKFFAGGWVPVSLGILVFLLMTTWMRGRALLFQAIGERNLPLDAFVADVAASNVHRVRGTGVFMTANAGSTPIALLHHFKHNQVLHELLVIVNVKSASVPFVSAAERLEVHRFDAGIASVVVRSGFLERADVPALLATAGLDIDPARTTYYLGRETLVPTPGRKGGLAYWRKALFIFIARNAQSAPGYFGLPPNRVVELGMQIEL